MNPEEAQKAVTEALTLYKENPNAPDAPELLARAERLNQYVLNYKPEKAPKLTQGQAVKLAGMDFLETVLPDPVMRLMGGKTGFPSAEELQQYQDMSYADRISSTARQSEETKRNIAGVDPAAEGSFFTSVTRGATDPLNIVGFGKGVAQNLGNVAATLTGTTAGVGAGELAGRAKLSPLASELLAATAGGVAGFAAGSATGAAFQTGAYYARNLSPSEMLADSHIKAKLEMIRQSEGQPLEVRLAAINELREVAPNLNLPFGAIASDNPIVKSWLQEVSSSDVEFRAKFEESADLLSKELLGAYEQLLGDQSPVSMTALRSMMEESSAVQRKELQKSLDARLEPLAAKERELHSRLFVDSDSIDVGNAVNKTVAAREALVRGQAQLLYNSAIKEGTTNGTRMTPQEVSAMYQTAKQLGINDIFGTQPNIATMLKSKWKPVKNEDGTFELPDASLADLDSLKRAINKGIRETKDPTVQAKLLALKGQFRDQLSSIATRDPDFISRYQEADAFYFEGLGIPLSNEGMKSLDRSRFASTTANQLKNPEVAEDLLSFIGPAEGIPIIQQSLRVRAQEQGVVDYFGNVDQKKLEGFVNNASNRRLIKMSGMEGEFADVQSGLSSIRQAQAEQTNNFNEQSALLGKGFFNAIAGKEIDAVITEFVSRPDRRKQYIREIERLNPEHKDLVMRSLQQEFMNSAVRSQGTINDYIGRHREAAVELWGPEYVSNMAKLGKASDRLMEMETQISLALGRTPMSDFMTNATNLTTAEVVGTLRNQVMSSERKAIHMVSVAITRGGSKGFERESGNILLDPDIVKILANPTQGKSLLVRTKDTSLKAARDVGRVYAEALAKIGAIQTYRGMRGGEEAFREEQYQNARPPLRSAAN